MSLEIVSPNPNARYKATLSAELGNRALFFVEPPVRFADETRMRLPLGAAVEPGSRVFADGTLYTLNNSVFAGIDTMQNQAHEALRFLNGETPAGKEPIGAMLDATASRVLQQ